MYVTLSYKSEVHTLGLCLLKSNCVSSPCTFMYFASTDCKTFLQAANCTESGVYTLSMEGIGTFSAYCDMATWETYKGGWTVIQQRIDDSVDFYRGWAEYQEGFGDPEGNFWIGLDKLHALTASPVTLLGIMEEYSGTESWIYYIWIFYSWEWRTGVCTWGGKSNSQKELTRNDEMPFATYDNTNSPNPGCSQDRKGAWWFKGCGGISLNGPYHPEGHASCTKNDNIYWGNKKCLKSVVMKIKWAKNALNRSKIGAKLSSLLGCVSILLHGWSELTKLIWIAVAGQHAIWVAIKYRHTASNEQNNILDLACSALRISYNVFTAGMQTN